MDPFAFFFRHKADLLNVTYPRGSGQDNPRRVGQASAAVECCLQMDGRPEPAEGQGRRGSEQPMRIFFRSDPGIDAGAVFAVDGVSYSARGPAYDDSGLAPMLDACWCVDARRAD